MLMKKGMYWLGKKRTSETLKKMSESQKGRKLTEEHKTKLSLAKKGKKYSEEYKKKMSEILKGKNHYNWQGGKTSELLRIRRSREYRLWRTAVYERDDYTCVWCLNRGGKLNADHIKPFAHYPELRFAIDNGRTLCEDCHRTTDTFGAKSAKFKPNTL